MHLFLQLRPKMVDLGMTSILLNIINIGNDKSTMRYALGALRNRECVCVCVCVCACTYTYVNVCMYTRICICTQKEALMMIDLNMKSILLNTINIGNDKSTVRYALGALRNRE